MKNNERNKVANIEVKLPELGEGVNEGELVKWLVKPGDSVKPDQVIAEVLTDKATVEIPTPHAGKVLELKFKPGQIIAVEATLLTLEAAAAAAPPPATTKSSGTEKSPTPSQQPPAKTSAAAVAPTSAPAATSGGGHGAYLPPADSHVLATPATRRFAREAGVDINGISGTGLAGRVTREDVAATIGQGAGNAPITTASTPTSFVWTSQSVVGTEGEERVGLVGIRRKIAESMQNSKRIIPHFTLGDEANVTKLVAVRDSLKSKYSDKQSASGKNSKPELKITYLPFVMKALISTLRKFPMVNASIDDAKQEIVYKKHFHIGFAADTPNGLVVPVVRFADQKTIAELSYEIQDLSARARDNKLKVEEMKGATITITNIGSIGGMFATPIINHPEVAILGMYKIFDKPVVNNGQLATLKAMNFTLTADHRLIDGAVAARFLSAFIEKIEDPADLMLDMR